MVDILSKGLRVERAISEAEWLRLGREIAVRGRGWQWQVGDWWALRDGEVTAEVLKVLDELGVDLKTVRNWAAVCKAIPLEERVEGLSLSHHREVVGLPPRRGGPSWRRPCGRGGPSRSSGTGCGPRGPGQDEWRWP